MAPSGSNHATSTSLTLLLQKLNDPDPDIRFMSLNDVVHMLQTGHSTLLLSDQSMSKRIVDGILRTLIDQNGDVQNNAIKCIGPFVTKAPSNIIPTLIERLVDLEVEDSVDSSIICLAIRAVVISLPRPVSGGPASSQTQIAYEAVSRALIPRLIEQPGRPAQGLLKVEIESGQDNNGLDVVTEVARCFGPVLRETEIQGLQHTLTEVLLSRRCGSVVKRKAISTLSTLSSSWSDVQMSAFISYSIEIIRQATPVQPQTKTMLNAYAALARANSQRFGPYLQNIMPFVLSPLSQELIDRQTEEEPESDDVGAQLEDTRESALMALDAFQTHCPTEMLHFRAELVQAARRFLKYDPNFADDQDDDMEREDIDLGGDDDDFEEETGFEDEDDASWKLRRCAARLLFSQTRDVAVLEDDTLLGIISDGLLQRCTEREESVRTEVLAALTSLIKTLALTDAQSHIPNIGQVATPSLSMSRKRRRKDSSAGVVEQQPTSNGYHSPTMPISQSKTQERLILIGAVLEPKAISLINTSSVPTKEASISALLALVYAQHGRPLLNVSSVLDATVKAIENAGDTDHNMRILSLRLLRALAETHSSTLLQAHLERTVVILVTTASVRYSKVALESVMTMETYIKALTPPRSAAMQPQSGSYLMQFHTVLQQAVGSDVDIEIRTHAIKAIGLLVGRTSGTQLLDLGARQAAFDLLADRIRNELTRFAAIVAVKMVTSMARSSNDLPAAWLAGVTSETGSQLRKVDRALRIASLDALGASLKHIDKLDDATIDHLLQLLLPSLRDADTITLAPTLSILGAILTAKPDLAHRPEVTAALCDVSQTAMSDTALDALLGLVETVGSMGRGKHLMSALLKTVGVAGSPAVVGQSIGTLLVASSTDVGVTLDDFVKELQGDSTEAQKSLALHVLGEAGLRMGSRCSLKPDDFSTYFESTDKVSLAAANALGRACAGDVATYLPRIIAGLDGAKPYLLLHSVKEALQHGNAEAAILRLANELWTKIMMVAQAEDNKTVGAECIGRLALMEPATYVPRLMSYLQDTQATVRAMVIIALSFMFADSEADYESVLEPVIVEMLITMLEDADINNRRLGLITFGSAVRNKPRIVLPHMGRLFPLVVNETFVHKELVRIVNMGPFKHQVDEGLETRKTAYSTLYLLMEACFSRLPVMTLFDRVIAGIEDEHDIKILSCLTLGKLVVMAPDVTRQRSDGFAAVFRPILAFQPKENTVKHEVEKIDERCKALLRVSLQITKACAAEGQGVGGGRAWEDFYEWARVEKKELLTAAEDEGREKSY